MIENGRSLDLMFSEQSSHQISQKMIAESKVPNPIQSVPTKKENQWKDI